MRNRNAQALYKVADVRVRARVRNTSVPSALLPFYPQYLRNSTGLSATRHQLVICSQRGFPLIVRFTSALLPHYFRSFHFFSAFAFSH